MERLVFSICSNSSRSISRVCCYESNRWFCRWMFTALWVGVGTRPEVLAEDRSGSAVRSCSRTPLSLRLCEGFGIDLSTTMLFSVSIIPFFFCRGALIHEFAPRNKVSCGDIARGLCGDLAGAHERLLAGLRSCSSGARCRRSSPTTQTRGRTPTGTAATRPSPTPRPRWRRPATRSRPLPPLLPRLSATPSPGARDLTTLDVEL